MNWADDEEDLGITDGGCTDARRLLFNISCRALTSIAAHICIVLALQRGSGCFRHVSERRARAGSD